MPVHKTNSNHYRFLMVLKLQPPEDLVAHSLISGQVVQLQPATGRRRRAEASARGVTVVSKGSPLALASC